MDEFADLSLSDGLQAPQHDTASTTLAEAITAFPELGKVCSTALIDEFLGSVGPGLKIMRLVSKHIRAAMLRVVQRFDLNLDGKADGLMDMMSALHTTQLSCLRVTVNRNIVGKVVACNLFGVKVWRVAWMFLHTCKSIPAYSHVTPQYFKVLDTRTLFQEQHRK